MAEGRAALWQLHLGPDYPGFKVFAYAAGTTTEQTIWGDSDKTDAIVQPYVTGSDGWATFYGDGDYNLVIQDRDGVTIKTLDPIRITDDQATIWEGSHGTTLPAATPDSRWHLFTTHTVDDEFTRLSINNGAKYVDLTGALDAGIIDVTDSPYLAAGDGVADDTAALQEAVDAGVAAKIAVKLPAGNYRTTAPVGPKTEAFGFQMYGDGLQSTTITGDHSAGPVLTLNRSNSGIRDLTVDASAVRQNATTSNNHGIYMEPEDVVGKAIAEMYCERVRVINQPGSGFVQVGQNQLSVFRDCLSQSNGNHGFVYDSGTLSGRTNKVFTGLVTMDTCWSLLNTGHGMVVGNPNDTAQYGNTRFLILNCEFDQNAKVSSTRFADSDSWIRAENVTFENCAFGSTDGGIYFLGRNLHLRNQRSVLLSKTLELDTDSVTTSTYGIRIDGLRVLNTAQNPVIKVSDLTNVHSIEVSTYGTISNMTTMFTSGTLRATWNKDAPPMQVARKVSAQSVTSSTVLVDAANLAIPLRNSESVWFEAELRYSGNSTGDIKIGFSAPAGANIRWQESGSVYIASGDTITTSNSDLTETSTRAYGAATGTRIASIRGRVNMGTTAGDFKVQFAQNTSNATSVNLLEGSVLKVYRGNANI